MPPSPGATSLVSTSAIPTAKLVAASFQLSVLSPKLSVLSPWLLVVSWQVRTRVCPLPLTPSHTRLLLPD